MTISSTQYDTAFSKIQNLTWLPWVGSNFFQRPAHKRLLVVGESHYFKNQAECEERSKDTIYTRDVVSESLVDYEWTTPTLNNIPKLLFMKSSIEIDRARLWGDSAYYNFIQRPVDYNRDGLPERPTPDDFITGWQTFIEVVRIIQPSHCLFIGVTAANSFNHAMSSPNLSFVPVVCTKKVGRTWARKARLEIDGTTTELCFVQHTGKYFRCSLWHDYLEADQPGLMNWLDAESYTTKRDGLAA